MYLSPAQITELETLQRRERGVLRPQAVVEYARTHPTSALHRHPAWKDWDNGRLAEAYCRTIARQMIQVFIVPVAHPTDRARTLQVRAMVSTPLIRERYGGYTDKEIVRNDRDLRRSCLVESIEKIEELITRFGWLDVVVAPLEPALAALRQNLVRIDAAPPPPPPRPVRKRSVRVTPVRKRRARKKAAGSGGVT